MQQPYGYYHPQVPTQQQFTQNNNIISVRAKEEALYYPVAPGNSIIFRKEDGSSIYIKTMSYSTTEPPIFEEFCRVIQEPKKENKPSSYSSEIDKIWEEINALKNVSKNTTNDNKRKENGGN